MPVPSKEERDPRRLGGGENPRARELPIPSTKERDRGETFPQCRSYVEGKRLKVRPRKKSAEPLRLGKKIWGYQPGPDARTSEGLRGDLEDLSGPPTTQKILSRKNPT